MVPIIVLIAIAIASIVLVVSFFVILKKESGSEVEEQKVEPITDMSFLNPDSSNNEEETVSLASSGEDYQGMDENLKEAKERLAALEQDAPHQDAQDAQDTEERPPEPPVTLTGDFSSFSSESQEANSNEDSSRVSELEQQLLAITEKAKEQAAGALEVIKGLEEENDSLKKAQEELANAKPEAVEVDDSAHQEKMEQIKGDFQNEIGQLRDMIQSSQQAIADLKQEKQKVEDELKQFRENPPEPQPESSEADNEELKALTDEVSKLKEEREDFDRTFGKIKDMNSGLIEKEKWLQYELTKSRAQCAGLERLSLNFQKQIKLRQQESAAALG